MGLWNPVGSKVAIVVCILQLGQLIQAIQGHFKIRAHTQTHRVYENHGKKQNVIIVPKWRVYILDTIKGSSTTHMDNFVIYVSVESL